ncbi:MAG: chorismate synthase, partial [Kocuria sp.]|nr:chorismate synthase [Kocuria sp.]
VAEAMVALVLAQAALEKFGGDSIAETARNKDAYLAAIPENLRTSPELADPSELAALDEVRGDLS